MLDKVRNHFKKRHRTKHYIVVAAISAMVLAPSASASYVWRTLDKDADYGAGFSYVEASEWTCCANYHARPMRVQVKGKPGTRVTISIKLECEYYDPDWPEDEYWETQRRNLSFHPTQLKPMLTKHLSMYGEPLTWWTQCEVTVFASTRDSGPLIAKVQARYGSR